MNQKLGTLLLASTLLCGCVSPPVPSAVKTGPLLSRMDNAELEAYLRQLQNAIDREQRSLRLGQPANEQSPEVDIRNKLLFEIQVAHVELTKVAREVLLFEGLRAKSREEHKEDNRRLCQNETDPETILKGFHIFTLEVQDLPIHEIARLINREIASVCPFWRRPSVKADAKLPPVPITLSLDQASVWDACRLLAGIANAEMVWQGRRLHLRPATPKPPPEPDGPPGVPEVPGLYNRGPDDPFAHEWKDPFSRRPIDPMDPFCGGR